MLQYRNHIKSEDLLYFPNIQIRYSSLSAMKQNANPIYIDIKQSMISNLTYQNTNF